MGLAIGGIFLDPLDLVDAAVSAARGNLGDAALGVVTAVPLLGIAAGITRIGKRGAKFVAKGGTETVQRWMSRAELKNVKETGLFRGGRGGIHYATDVANSNPLRARQRLSLDHTPEVRVELEVPAGSFSQQSRVSPLIENGRVTMLGGGMERTAFGEIPTQVIRVFE